MLSPLALKKTIPLALTLCLLATAYFLWQKWHSPASVRQPEPGVLELGVREAVPSPVVDAHPVELPPEIKAQVSQWSSAPSKPEAQVSLSPTGNAPRSESVQSPFPEPKKVLTPDEIAKGTW